MAIDWVPVLKKPFHRHLEVFCVGFVIFCEIGLAPLSFCLTLYILIIGSIYSKTIFLLYLAFVYYDRHTGDRGGRGNGSAWLRGWSVWKHCQNYFPVDLVKTVDLPPDRNYLFCVFPHGVISLGAGSNFITSHSKWSTLFPGIRAKAVTLHFTLYMPIQRELLLNAGLSSASANSLTALLTQSNDPADESNKDGFTSNGVGLIVGGAREALQTRPNTYKFVLKNRKGFARIALQTGAPIVPVLSFGENEIYEVIDYQAGSLGRLIHDIIKWFTNVSLAHYNGRGYFQYNYGLIPRRRPITTVIGAPIPVHKTPNPTDEDINRTHAIFCTQLNELFETHKGKYVENADQVHLEYV